MQSLQRAKSYYAKEQVSLLSSVCFDNIFESTLNEISICILMQVIVLLGQSLMRATQKLQVLLARIWY